MISIEEAWPKNSFFYRNVEVTFLKKSMSFNWTLFIEVIILVD